MRNLWIQIATVFMLSLVTASVFAGTSVWKIEKNNASIYLVGTCHVLNASDHPLPAEFDKAYEAASIVVFETDIAGTGSPAFQLKFLQALAVEKGKTLETSLKPETWKALSDFLKARNMPVESFMQYSPAGMTLMLTMMEYQRLGMSPAYGVDFHYEKKARAASKTVEHLESLDEQLAFIANMGKGQEDQMLMYTLKELGNSETMIKQLKTHWRNGDAQALDEVALKEMREKFNSTYKDLIVKRNNNWMPQIEDMLTNAQVETVMVGALHLVGRDGLLAQLKAKGYKVEQL